MKGMTASFSTDALTKYEFLFTSKVLAGLLPVHVPAEHEAVYTHLSAENTIPVKSATTSVGGSKKASKVPWFRCPRKSVLNGIRTDVIDLTDRKHVCASCRGDHGIKKCVEASKNA